MQPRKAGSFAAGSVAMLAVASALASTSVLASAAFASGSAGAHSVAGPIASGVVMNQPEDGSDLVAVRLASRRAALVPGTEATIGLVFTVDRDWHIYWHGLNDTGYAPEIEWSMPAGVELVAVGWPAPRRLVSPGGILDHVYEGEVTLPVTVRVAGSVAPGTRAEIRAKVSWLVCHDVCLPGDGSAEIVLPVADAAMGEPVLTPDAPRIDAARDRTPAGKTSADTTSADRAPEGVILAWAGADDPTLMVRAPGAQRAAFYPLADGLTPTDIIADGESRSGDLRVRFKPPKPPTSADDLSEEQRAGRRARGVVELWLEDGTRRVFGVDHPLPGE